MQTRYFSAGLAPLELEVSYRALLSTEKKYYTNELSFLVVVRGKAALNLNGSELLLTAGDFCLLQPYHIRYFQLSSHQHLELIEIRFSLGLALLLSQNKQAYNSIMQKFQKFFPVVKVTATDLQAITDYCRWIMTENQSTKSSLTQLNLSLTAFLSTIYTTAIPQARKVQLKSNSGSSLQLLQIYHQEKLSIQKLANKLQISTADFAQNIQQLTNQTPKQQLNQVRIRNAAALMIFDDLSLNAIGRICGFQSEANFYKQFRLQYHQTPQSYRRHLINLQNQLVSLDGVKIIGYLLEHCSENLNLVQTATDLKTAPTKIQQLVKKDFNCTFKNLITDLRLNLAQNYLINSDLTVSQIYLKSGFQDLNTFTRNYKKKFQQTPSTTQKKAIQKRGNNYASTQLSLYPQ